MKLGLRIAIMAMVADVDPIDTSVIAGTSVSTVKRWATLAKKLDTDEIFEAHKAGQLTPSENYKVRPWETVRTGKVELVDLLHAKSVKTAQHTRRKERQVKIKRATKRSIKQPKWWATFGVGEMFNRVDTISDTQVVAAALSFGLRVERLTNNDGSEIDGPPVFGVLAVPSMPERVRMSIKCSKGYVKLFALAEAYGLAPGQDAEMIRELRSDPRFKVGRYQNVPAVKWLGANKG